MVISYARARGRAHSGLDAYVSTLARARARAGKRDAATAYASRVSAVEQHSSRLFAEERAAVELNIPELEEAVW
jgi:hypothetical protein